MRVVTISEPLPVTLFGTSACHLCEQALALVLASDAAQLLLTETDISASDDLFERYGLTIPVLRREDTGAELGWPFDAAMLADFLSQAPALKQGS